MRDAACPQEETRLDRRRKAFKPMQKSFCPVREINPLPCTATAKPKAVAYSVMLNADPSHMSLISAT